MCRDAWHSHGPLEFADGVGVVGFHQRVVSYLLHEVGWDTDAKLPSQIGTLTVWLGFFVFGYLQWFKLLPYTIGRIKARRQRSARK